MKKEGCTGLAIYFYSIFGAIIMVRQNYLMSPAFDNALYSLPIIFLRVSERLESNNEKLISSSFWTSSDIKINFAHQTFKWSNEARNNAGVYVVIIGFSFKERTNKIIFTYDKPNSQIPTSSEAKNINCYLVDGKDIFIKNRRNPICNVPKMTFGSMSNDGGTYYLMKMKKINY